MRGTFAAAALVCISAGIAFSEPERPQIFRGMCDASAAVFAGPDHIVVANDEDNILRVYNASAAGKPKQTIDLAPLLSLSSKKETDLEAAAVKGDTIFWIGSHGRNKNGKESPSRQILFATKMVTTKTSIELTVKGQPYRDLLSDLAHDPQLEQFRLLEASKLAPKKKGALNIEGLAATPEGHLLIGFRNPIPNRRSLLVPLLNPDEVLAGKRANFGKPILLDLGGLGIREIVPYGTGYLLLAGPFDGENTSKLFQWDGAAKPTLLKDLSRLTGKPEAIAVEPQSPKALRILTDNGSSPAGAQNCKDAPEHLQSFFGYNIQFD